MAPPDTVTIHQSLFRPGENCAAVARADRAAFIVDADDYFRAFRHAAERAEHSIFILAWDFDSRTRLGEDADGNEILLGEFLNGLARRNRNLRIRVLDWDFPVVYGIDRELPPTIGLTKWKPHKRVDFRFDDTHPVGGSHHQKIVLVDDKLAFSGGLDLTNRRWDTPEHKPNDPKRVFDGKPYPPFHDVMIGVDGEAAEALARVARERWFNATGQRLRPVKAEGDPWPKELAVDVKDVTVSIACTAPKTDESEGIRHVETLYLDMINRARDYIYIENQYFTSEKIGQAIARRLAEPDGPEILLVTRLLSHGWLEEITMTALRTKLVRELRAADRFDNFHVYYPDIPDLCEGTCLDIHSKVMIVDDEWLRIGSANLSNRSMGMDTECDVTVEARGPTRVRKAIRAFRDRLLAEHDCADAESMERELKKAGRLYKACEALGTDERRLKCLEAPELTQAKLVLAKVGDPEEPILEGIVKSGSTGGGGAKVRSRVHQGLLTLGGIFAAAIALWLLWTYTPLRDMITRDNAMRAAEAFANLWWAPILVVLAYTPASFVMFPRWVITMTAVIAFGAWQGFFYAYAGVLLAASATFLPGRLVGEDTVRRLAGPKLHRIARILQRRGLLAVTIVRLVPVAPFPVVNLVMGAMRIRYRDFMLGTFLGMLPGMLAATVLSDQLANLLDDSTPVNWWMIGAAILMLATFAFFGQRYLRRTSR